MNAHLEQKLFDLLNGLPAETIGRINEAAELTTFAKGETVMRKGDPATHFHFHASGKGVFEETISDGFTVTLGTVRPGYCYGWSCLLPQETVGLTVVCTEESEVAKIEGSKLEEMLEADPKIGMIFMRNLNRLLSDRLRLRTDQVVSILASHPDLERI
jgi:glutaminase